MSRQLVLLALSVLFMGLAWSVHEPDADVRLEGEAVRMQRSMDRRASELVAGSERWLHELAGSGAEQWMRLHAQELAGSQNATGIIYLGFAGDSLVCWTGQLPADLDLLRDLGEADQLTFPDATYLHHRAAIGTLRVHALAPVWLTPSIENRHLRRGFHASLGAPDGLMAQPSTSAGPAVKDASGHVILRLAWRDGALDVGPWILWKLGLLLIGAFLLIAALWHYCVSLAERDHVRLSAVLFLAGLLLGRWLVLRLLPSAPFDRLPLFDPALYAASILFPSLGDLVINGLLLLIGAAFVQRSTDRLGTRPVSLPESFVSWVILLAAAAWITNTIIGLVNDSSVDLDLNHVQSLNGASAAAVLGIALLFGSWLLLADTFLAALRRSSASRSWLYSGALVLFISIAFHHLQGIRDTILFLWPVPLLVLIRWAHGRYRFVHAVIGLGVLAAITSHVLTKYTRDREQRERIVLAERSSVREDPVVELLFREVAPVLRTDPALHALITSGKPCTSGDLELAIRRIFFGNFWERYDVHVYAFDGQGVPRCNSEGQPPRSFESIEPLFSEHTALAEMPDLFYEHGGAEGSFYHARLVVMPNANATPGQIIIELHPRSADGGLGFPDLLLSGEDPLSGRLERYAMARYEHGLLADRANTNGVPLHWTRELGADGTLWYLENGIEYLAKGSPDSTVLILGKPMPSLLDRATTFSYLFALFALLLAAVMLARAILHNKRLPSLLIAGKVRAALLVFGVVSLLFFGAGAQRLLTNQYTERAEASLLEKARSAHMELQQKLNGQPPLDHRNAPYLEHILAQQSNVLFSDITVYDVHGHLLSSSRPQVFASGLLGPRMDATAYVRMVIDQTSDFVNEEAIGTAQYQSAYLPLRDRQGQVLGYLSLPSFADQRQQEQERSGVLVAVVNLFVLLFALSILVALFISNWTTRPLSALKRSLESVELQDANRPLTYPDNDEVGQLVEVYNRKVEELRENAERLARSERESAWREMARQVAHEIKNPLTPMKLGIEHFQHAWDPQAPDARERLERFSRSMVQQIDALNGVATAFSQFAQMPIAQPITLDLNEVARAAVDVFSASPDVVIELHGSSPLLVHADREHLLRVFNNLLKNAMQAIPEGGHGRIDVRLSSRDGHAIAEVRDNGTGIPEEARERIFTPSFTTKSSGMGLGLAMVKRIVENAGGRVWFETGEGEGTSFFVALPLRS